MPGRRLVPRPVLSLLTLLACAAPLRAQQLEVDHLWIHVSPGAPEAQVLSDAGLQIDANTGAIQHAGQGTASVFFRFSNVYLELIWVEDAALLQRIAPEFAFSLVGGAAASPFGIGLRPLERGATSVPFEAAARTAEWMRPGTRIRAAIPRDAARSDPSIFVIPRYMRWDERTEAQPELLAVAQHEPRLGTLTAITISGPGLPSDAPAARTLMAEGLVNFADAPTHLLELEFDHRRGDRLDLRPALPLVIYH